jgi:hypothetical protein
MGIKVVRSTIVIELRAFLFLDQARSRYQVVSKLLKRPFIVLDYLVAVVYGESTDVVIDYIGERMMSLT